MTERKKALRTLLDSVRSGDVTASLVAVAFPKGGPGSTYFLVRTVCARNSIDAAKALHKAVLHERLEVVMTYTPRYENECSVRIWHPTDGEWIGRADTPARAWLIAILMALIAKEGDA